MTTSHNISDRRNFCNSGLALHHGMLEFFGDIEKAIACHEEPINLA